MTDIQVVFYAGLVGMVVLSVVSFVAGYQYCASRMGGLEWIDWDTVEPLATYKNDGRECLVVSPADLAKSLPHYERGLFLDWYKRVKRV